MAKGEVSVDLRLTLAKLRQDIARATSMMKVSLSGGSIGMGKDIDKATTSLEKHESRIKKVTEAIKSQKQMALEAWRAQNPGGVARGQKVTYADEPTRPSGRFARWYPGQTVPATGAGLATKPPSAIPPIIPAIKAPIIPESVRTAFSAALSRFGLSLTRFGIIGAIVGASFLALRKVVNELSQAFERARTLYAKNLSSGGLGQGYVTQRAILAQVIGVSENEVMQYGSAISFLNAKLATATRIINETNPTLSATSMNFQVMKQNISAAWAKIAEAISPALNRLYELIGAMSKLAALSGNTSLIGKAMSIILDSIIRIIAIGSVVYSAIELMVTSVVDSIKWMLSQVNNLLAKFHVPGFEKKAVNFQNTKDAAQAFKEILKVALAAPSYYKSESPGAPVSPNRMVMSSWEKMGMVIGSMGGKNPQEETAKNTKKLVNLFEKIVGGTLQRTGTPVFNNPSYSQP